MCMCVCLFTFFLFILERQSVLHLASVLLSVGFPYKLFQF
jgi:hypothetical protein